VPHDVALVRSVDALIVAQEAKDEFAEGHSGLLPEDCREPAATQPSDFKRNASGFSMSELTSRYRESANTDDPYSAVALR